MSLSALAALNELFFEICSGLGLEGSGSHSFPSEFFEVLGSPGCRSPSISFSKAGGRLIAYVECGDRYAVAELMPGGEMLSGRGLGYVECRGKIFTVKIILAGSRVREQGLEI